MKNRFVLVVALGVGCVFVHRILVLSEEITCYQQESFDCVEYEPDLEEYKCNTEPCLYQIILDEEGEPIVQNGFYQVNYDCPANTLEPVIQTGTVYVCNEGAPAGDYAS